VIRLQEEFFLPGEVILEQGSAVDQLYFVCYGALVSSRACNNHQMFP
jgi:CRP-like cAMP-binding protein